MTATTIPAGPGTEQAARPWAGIACGAAALGTIPVFAMSTLTGDTGQEITAGLRVDAGILMGGSVLAVLVAAALFLAAVRLGRAVGGDTGTVVTAAGSAVALTYGAYYAVFGAGGIVATQMLEEPGAGLGEAASLLLNVMEVTRYAPGLVLVAAVALGGPRLPRWVRVMAGALAVMTLVPLTSWVAALAIPLWMAAVAAVLRD